LLLNVSDPEIVPLAAGIKAALSVKLCPAAIVNGKDAPVKANCEPLLVSDDTVTLPPLALTVMARVAVVPTFTLPKFTGDGAILNWPAAFVTVVVPVPVSGMF
jgi:hypothetical protein